MAFSEDSPDITIEPIFPDEPVETGDGGDPDEAAGDEGTAHDEGKASG